MYLFQVNLLSLSVFISILKSGCSLDWQGRWINSLQFKLLSLTKVTCRQGVIFTDRAEILKLVAYSSPFPAFPTQVKIYFCLGGLRKASCWWQDEWLSWGTRTPTSQWQPDPASPPGVLCCLSVGRRQVDVGATVLSAFKTTAPMDINQDFHFWSNSTTL